MAVRVAPGGNPCLANPKPVGEFAENISYGTGTGIEAVCQFLVDDGNPTKEQRAVMMEPKYKKVGIQSHVHKKYGMVNVIVVTQDMIKKNAEDPI